MKSVFKLFRATLSTKITVLAMTPALAAVFAIPARLRTTRLRVPVSSPPTPPELAASSQDE